MGWAWIIIEERVFHLWYVLVYSMYVHWCIMVFVSSMINAILKDIRYALFVCVCVCMIVCPPLGH